MDGSQRPLPCGPRPDSGEGVGWARPVGFAFRPIGYRPGALWGEASATWSLKALPGGRHVVLSPTKGL